MAQPPVAEILLKALRARLSMRQMVTQTFITDGDESSLLLRVQQYRVACFPHHRSNEYVQFTRICRVGLP